MSQFRQLRMFPSDKSLNLDFKEGEVCVDFIEISALEAAQKEIQKLTAALKVAEDALDKLDCDDMCGCPDVAREAKEKIQKIKKGKM